MQTHRPDFGCLGSIQRWKNTSSGFHREESTLPFRENRSRGGSLQLWDLFVFQMSAGTISSAGGTEESRSEPGQPRVFLLQDRGPGRRQVGPHTDPHLSALPQPLPVNVAAAGKGRQGHGRGRRTQSRSKAVRASSARARRLPGAPAPWRRYLGCLSGGTWWRPQVPGSGAGCGSGTGRRIQEVAGPPARHLPATLRPASQHQLPSPAGHRPAHIPTSFPFTGFSLLSSQSPPLQPLVTPFPSLAPPLAPGPLLLCLTRQHPMATCCDPYQKTNLRGEITISPSVRFLSKKHALCCKEKAPLSPQIKQFSTT